MRNIYVDAFRMDLWLVYLAVWILLTMAAILMDRIRRKSKSKVVYWPSHNADEYNPASDHILRAIGAVCQQGTYKFRTVPNILDVS